MKQPDPDLLQLLGTKLNSEGFDLVDLIQIPTKGDRLVRARTLEEALDEFDAPGSDDAVGYLIQVRPKSQAPSDTAHTSPTEELSLENFTIQSDASGDSLVPKQSIETVYVDKGMLNVPYLFKTGAVLFAAGDFTLARNVYQAVLQSGERSGQAHYWLGRCFEADEHLDEAVRSYEESIAYDPTLDAYQRFAALLIRKKKDQEAAEAMERALVLEGTAPASRFELHRATGNCWMRTHHSEKAQAHYLKALAIDPGSDAIQANLGALHLQAGNIHEARKRFEAALGIQPRNDKAVAGLGSCALSDGETRVAHDLFARALGIQLANPTAVFYLVKCAFEIKSYATAARIVAEYVDSAPVNTNLLYSLAGLQYHLGRIDIAQASVEKVLELQPEHGGAKELLSLIGRYAHRE